MELILITSLLDGLDSSRPPSLATMFSEPKSIMELDFPLMEKRF